MIFCLVLFEGRTSVGVLGVGVSFLFCLDCFHFWVRASSGKVQPVRVMRASRRTAMRRAIARGMRRSA